MRGRGWILVVAAIAVLAGCPRHQDANGGGGGRTAESVSQPQAQPDPQAYHDRVGRAVVATGRLQDALRKEDGATATQALNDVRSHLRDAQTYVPQAELDRLLEAQDQAVKAQAAMADHGPTAVVAAHTLMTDLVGIQEAYGSRTAPRAAAAPGTGASKPADQTPGKPADATPVADAPAPAPVVAHPSRQIAAHPVAVHHHSVGGGGGPRIHHWNHFGDRVGDYAPGKWQSRGELPGTTPNSGAPSHRSDD